MKTNFHTHTYRCRHAQGSAEEYIKEALSAGVSSLGFSEHGPFPENNFGMRMPYSELEEYIEELKTLTEKYQTAIILWKGLEIEYLPEFENYYEELLSNRGLDYLLMGEHFYIDKQQKCANITSADSTETYLDYARSIARGMKSGFFKAVAHPDIFMMNHFAWDKNCEKASEIIISTAEDTKTALEYNANGLRRGIQQFPDGLRCPYPHRRFWQMVSASRVAVFVGSDCHNPAQVWDTTVDMAYEQLSEYNIVPVRSLLSNQYVPE